MNEFNRIVICDEEYCSQEEFENAIKRAVMVLLENNYIMTVKYDDKGLGIVCIDFNSDDKTLGEDYPYWLSPFEIESVITDEERDEMDGDDRN